MTDLGIRHRVAGKKWKKPTAGHRWGDQPALVGFLNTRICPLHETGIYGAIREAASAGLLTRAVSIGSGIAAQERELVSRGLVEHFDLFEISPDRIAETNRLAEAEGISDKITTHMADALKQPVSERYDLVFWSHSLHHMFDVDHAIQWSIEALKPGGVLVVYDYIGPTRLQWTRAEIAMARKFLSDNAPLLGVDPKRVRGGNFFRRFKQYLRDPSEAPQSDLIASSYRRHTGTDINVLGGAMIHLCGGFIRDKAEQDPDILNRLISFDQSAKENGIAHYAFGLWRKPSEETAPAAQT